MIFDSADCCICKVVFTTSLVAGECALKSQARARVSVGSAREFLFSVESSKRGVMVEASFERAGVAEIAGVVITARR